MLGWVVGTLWACRAPEAPATSEAFTADALAEATAAVVGVGPRLVATEAEEDARAVIEQLFLDAGLADVASEPFTWDAWQPGDARLTVGDRTFEVRALSPSPPTTLTAALADGGDIGDTIAVYGSDDVSRAEAYADAAFGGAAAMVRVTEDRDLDGSLLVEVGHTLDGASLPSAAVDDAVGEALESLVGQPATLEIHSDVVVGHVSHNVVGRVKGRSGRPVFVTAHYDSWHLSESAFDNGLGVGALVVLAQRLAGGPVPEHDVVFLATSGEEQGLQGAMAWVAAHEDEVDDGELVLNLDVLWGMEGRFYVQATDEDLRAALLDAAAAEGIDAVDAGPPGLASDHVPFVARGVPAIWCTRWPDRHYHTDSDDLEDIDIDEAFAAVRSQWRVLAAAVGVPP